MAVYSTQRLSQVFKALANERRMHILKLLTRRSLSVMEIAERLDMSFKTCSFHLLKLEREGILKRIRKGKYNYYSPTDSLKKSGIYKQIIESY